MCKIVIAQARYFVFCSGLLVFLIAAPNAFAQACSVAPRITQRLDDAQRTLLPGNIHPLARAQYDRGLQDAAYKLDRITMTFRMTAAQQADLDALLIQQQDRSFPNFHRWLTPEQYATRFGVSQSDMAAIAAWLGTQGLTVVETARSGNWVAFTGTAGQVQAAFRMEIHRYTANGTNYFANASEPSVPSAFAGLVQGFRGLNNYPVKPQDWIAKRSATPFNRTSRRVRQIIIWRPMIFKQFTTLSLYTVVGSMVRDKRLQSWASRMWLPVTLRRFAQLPDFRQILRKWFSRQARPIPALLMAMCRKRVWIWNGPGRPRRMRH